MALLLSFISCTSNVQELETEQLQLLKQIVMTTEDFEPEADSRTLYQIAEGAVKCSWASNDTVGVFPDKGMQTCFPMTSENGMKNATFDGGGWALKDGSTYGAYYPFIGNMYLDKKSIPVSYKKQTQVGNGSIAHLGTYDYMVATPVAPEFGSAHFTFKHLGVLVQLRLTIPQAATLTSMKLVTEIKAFALEGKVNIMADAPSISPIFSENEIELTLQDISTTEENQVVILYMVLPPANLSEQTLKAVVVSNKGTLEYVLENKNFQAGKAYALTGTIKEAPIGNGTYQNGVVSIAEAGTMKKLLGDDYLNITSLKVVGPINGDDVYYLRKMLGGSNFSEADWGKLTTLDLSEATIVEGGEWYYESSWEKNYTSNNIIGDYMFYDCANLQNIILPNSVTLIGTNAFIFCDALISIVIPEDVTSIGDGVFSGCDALYSTTIGNGVVSIGDNAFYNCDALNSIIIPDNVTLIGDRVFYDCDALKNVTILSGSIGNEAFRYCSALTSAIIGNGVTSIGNNAFQDCRTLISITIGDGVTSIGSNAFFLCDALTSITIGSGINSIGRNAFSDCSALTSVTISNLSAWCKIEFGEYTSNPLSNGAKLYLNDKLLTELTIPEDITEINDKAFEGCSSIEKLIVPNNVTSIGRYTFRGCNALTSATIDNGVTSLGLAAFLNCPVLTSVTIGNGINSIGHNAFQDCGALTFVSIGSGITSIGQDVLTNCSDLNKFYCYATTPPQIYPFYGINSSATLYVPARCGSAYKSSDWGNHFKNIKEID